MDFLIDVTALMRRDLTGIGVYVKNLVDHLGAIPGMKLQGSWRLSRFAKRDLIRRHVSIPTAPFIPLLSELNLTGHDLFHGPDFRIPRAGRFAKVVTVHDLVIHEPDLVDARFAEEGRMKLRRTLLECSPSRIITVSEFTRSKLIEHYPQLEPIVTAIPLGVDTARFSNALHEGHESVIEGTYLLAAGSVEKRKNLATTIRAFEIVRQRVRDLRLVIAGGNGYGFEEIDARIAASPARDSILRLGFVSDEMLAGLYQGAVALLYPSLYEGFGIPILEAMAARCPVVTSSHGAMAETAGDAAILVDPLDAEGMAEAIEKVMHDSALRSTLIASGVERASRFTWERCAQATAQLYRNAV